MSHKLSMEEVVALLRENKPVPGIKEIPDVELGLEKSSPSKMSVRRKPWERPAQENLK